MRTVHTTVFTGIRTVTIQSSFRNRIQGFPLENRRNTSYNEEK